MATTSLWEIISKKPKRYPKLEKNLQVDIVVIGGGITGVTAARELINAGKQVAVVDSYTMGGVTTGLSSGNLYVAVQPYYQEIVKKFNLATAKTIADSRQFAIDYIEKNVNTLVSDCNFSRRPWYIYTNDDERISFLEHEVHIFKQLGIPIDYTANLPLSFPFKNAAVVENQARFNPLQYVIDMASDLDKKGGWLFENTRIIDLNEKEGSCTLKTENGYQITANKAIIATHTPIGINATQFFTAPYRSYVVGILNQETGFPEGHFWDLDQPHHVICTHSFSKHEPEVLLVTGSHHKTGQDKDAELNFKQLKDFIKNNLGMKTFDYHWSAQHYHSADDIPYIGLASRKAEHTYLATGYFADGLVYGTVAGILLSDLILGKENNWFDVYNSLRFTPLASAGFVFKENGNNLLQYYKDFPKPSTTNFDEIKTGEGKVVEIDREKCCVYRDEEQKLHIVSAVCPHMKCIVDWNNAEKTWDCPCHGSRFTTEGKVIEGPAQTDLKKKE